MRLPWRRRNELSLGIEGISGGSRVGQGAFGVVYRARQESLGRVVAVKVLNTPDLDAEARRRFEQECRALGALSAHPNIVAVYDSGLSASGHPYLVMDYLSGGTLTEHLRTRGPLPWPEVADMGVKLAGALAAAHAAGVLHRDVKPDNVLISAYGEPQLADFGVARIQGEAPSRTGMITGSLAQVAPEVLSGQPASEASDVYSLASTMYQLLAGRPPFVRDGEESLQPLIARILGEDPADLRGDGVPGVTWEALRAGLAKDPSSRTPTALAFGEALRAAQRAAGLEPTPLVGPVGGEVVGSPAGVDPTGTAIVRWRAKPPSAAPAAASRRPPKRRFVAVALALSLLVASVVVGLTKLPSLQASQGRKHQRPGPAAAGPGPTTTVTSSAAPEVASSSSPPASSQTRPVAGHAPQGHVAPPLAPSTPVPPRPMVASPAPVPASATPTPPPPQNQPRMLFQSFWRSNQGWSRVVQFKADGKPAWPGASEGWSGPIGIAEFPGHGEMQALSTLVFPNGKAFQQCYWRGDQRFCRQVDFNVDGSPRWPGASQGWSPPLDLAGSGLPGVGAVRATNTIVYPNGRTFQECYRRSSQGFCRQVNFRADGTPDWPSLSQGWSGPLGTEPLPGTGDVQAATSLMHLDGKAFTQSLWRGNQGFWRDVMFKPEGSPDWAHAPTWAGTTEIAQLPGAGPMQAANILVYAPPRP